MVEITISIKGEDSTYKQKFLVYENVMWDQDDPEIQKCIKEALENSKIEPLDIKIRGLIQIV